MAKYPANAMVLKLDFTGNGTYTKIGHATEHTQTKSAESTDVTDKDSSGWTSLEGFGVENVALPMSGFVSDDAQFVLLEQAVEANSIHNYELIYADGQITRGLFHASSLEYSAPANSAQTFSVTLMSSEPVVMGQLTDFLLDEAGANLTDENNQFLDDE